MDYINKLIICIHQKYLFTKLEIKPTSKQVVYDENSNLYKINKIDDDTQKSTPAFFDDICTS